MCVEEGGYTTTEAELSKEQEKEKESEWPLCVVLTVTFSLLCSAEAL